MKYLNNNYYKFKFIVQKLYFKYRWYSVKYNIPFWLYTGKYFLIKILKSHGQITKFIKVKLIIISRCCEILEILVRLNCLET